MLPSQKAQANSLVFLIGVTIGISCITFGLVYVFNFFKAQPVVTHTIDISPQDQTDAYHTTIIDILAKETITDSDMQTFLFEVRVPGEYQSAHLGLARAWGDQVEDPRALLEEYSKQILIK